MPRKTELSDANGKPLVVLRDGRKLSSDEILERDIQNVIKKVAQGKPLTKAERDLIQSAGINATPEQSEPTSLPKHTKADKTMRLIIERECDCSERKAYAWLNKLRDKHWNKSVGWRVQEVVDEIDHRRRKVTAGSDTDLKREKLTLECDILRDRRDRDRGEYVDLAQYESDIKAVYQAAIQTIDIWIKTTAAAVGSPDMKHKLESARRKAYAAVQSELESATERDGVAVADPADA